MRITKYRGKREDNGEWGYGAFYPIKDEDVYFIINNCKSIDFDDDDTTFNGYKVHKRSVGEFTGLHDKNGKDIYEGDIVECKKTTSKFSYKFTSVVTMQYGCFGVITDRFIALKDLIEGNIKIIGNVFENEDLVKL